MDLRFIDKCKELDWCVRYGDEYTELYHQTPAGEDFGFIVDTENFVENVKKYTEEYSPDEHIEMRIEAKISGRSDVPSIRELVNDADAIDEMLKNLTTALCELESEMEKEEENDAIMQDWYSRYTAILDDDEWEYYHHPVIHYYDNGRRALLVDGEEVYCGNQDEIIAVLKSLINMTERKLIKHVR